MRDVRDSARQAARRPSDGAHPPPIRLFVAIQLPAALAERAADVLPGDLRGLRRVPAALLHLTLAFIGSVPAETVQPARDALRAAARSSAPIDACLDRLGRFPRSGPPAVLWLGAGTGAKELGAVADRVRARLEERDLPFDHKPFAAHVTLARVTPAVELEDARSIEGRLAATAVPRLDFRVDSIQLVESVLSRKGARYVQLEEAALGQPRSGDPAGEPDGR